ncbi:MAG: hypothetical protein HY957_11070, partial [Nitrospirae bacterium]|nr:hypothetical protein [Nitrospirota bacterium]
MTELFNFVALREGFENGLPYFDTANPRRATIGYGFNIEVADYLLLVLNELGIIDDTMTAAQINARKSAFTTAINNTPHTGDRTVITQQLQTNLNQVASQYGFTSFQLNETQGRAIFEDIITGLVIGDVTIGGKEQRLDAWLTEYNIDVASLKGTKEYMALTSLFYNREIAAKKDSAGNIIRDEQGRRIPDSRSLIGYNLLTALENDNRAEAWYEIRYNSNGGSTRSRGIANRRYAESDLFSLYDAGSFTPAEAKEIMRMYTKHRSTIIEYEKNYTPTFPITDEIW